MLTLIFALPRAHAQTAPAASATPPAKDGLEVVTLSAFQVTSERDIGYTATCALAGGRIDTPLKETPSAVTIITAVGVRPARTGGPPDRVARTRDPMTRDQFTNAWRHNLRVSRRFIYHL